MLKADKRVHIATLTASALLVAVVVSARVYERAQRTMAESLGWEAAYSTELTLNGGAGTLQLWNASGDVEDTVRALNARLGGDHPALLSGENMAWGIESADGTVSRYLVFSPAGHGSSMIVVVRQEEVEFRKSETPPPASLLTDVPSFPGSRPVSFIADHAGGTAFELSDVSADAVTVRQYLRDTFAHAGWTSMSRGQALDIYKRGEVLCLVKVNSSSPGSPGRVTLIRKDLR
ncbi:MAG: hypothetical protein KJ626_15175 [Verrucomicrobia bacterium]|nr:hypothetical protein [Verrucomicrobiota bacterium]